MTDHLSPDEAPTERECARCGGCYENCPHCGGTGVEQAPTDQGQSGEIPDPAAGNPTHDYDRGLPGLTYNELEAERDRLASELYTAEEIIHDHRVRLDERRKMLDEADVVIRALRAAEDRLKAERDALAEQAPTEREGERDG